MAVNIPVSTLKKIQKHRFILKKIADANPQTRKKMLIAAPTQLFTVFKLICKMVADGKVKLGKARRHRKLIDEFKNTKASAIKARSSQKGGAIGGIISAVLPFLAPLVSKILK